jgi:hypothetical protein
MDIGRTEGIGGSGRIEGPQCSSKPAPSSATPGSARTDRAEFSASSQLISEALGLPSVRSERIDEVRQLLASGQLDSDARLEGALDAFLREQRDVLPG